MVFFVQAVATGALPSPTTSIGSTTSRRSSNRKRNRAVSGGGGTGGGTGAGTGGGAGGGAGEGAGSKKKKARSVAQANVAGLVPGGDGKRKLAADMSFAGASSILEAAQVLWGCGGGGVVYVPGITCQVLRVRTTYSFSAVLLLTPCSSL